MAEPADNCLISLNPATGNALGFVEATRVEDIPHRVQQARDVQATWAALRPAQRARQLQEAATALLANAPRLGTLLSEETGRPRQSGLREVQATAKSIAARLRLALSHLETRTRTGSGAITSLHHDPLGTCAVIIPWDSPVAIAHGLMIPALMAGNTVLLKPSPETPLIAQRMVEIYQRSLPDNVLQIVQGRDEQGKALVAANVQLIAFCGSTRAGKHIMASSAYGLKRMLLGLGGKNAAIVLRDADLDDAARHLVDSSLGLRPRCTAIERVFVDLQVAGELEHKVTELARRYRIGSWDDPNADIGPMISSTRREGVIALLLDALDRGAVALTGGSNHPEFFVRPTVLSQVDDSMEIAHKEVLGPVLCLSHFEHPRTAITAINRSPYGQSALVFGADPAATEIGRQLDAAVVGINKGLAGDEVPRVGAKHSGFGAAPVTQHYSQFTQSRILHR